MMDVCLGIKVLTESVKKQFDKKKLNFSSTMQLQFENFNRQRNFSDQELFADEQYHESKINSTQRYFEEKDLKHLFPTLVNEDFPFDL